MRNAKRNEILTRRDGVASPVSASHALAQNKLQSVIDAIPEDRLKNGIMAQLVKMENGDTKAAAFIVNLHRDGASRSGTTNIQQVAVQGASSIEHHNLSDRRIALVHYIANMGPMDLETLAERTKTPNTRIRDAIIDHPWFVRTHVGWDITAEARKDVFLQALPPPASEDAA